MSVVRILFVSDIMAKAGMEAVRRLLPRVIADKKADFVIANGENTAGGIGITPDLAEDLFSEGVDVITTGNHVWRQREIRPYIEKETRLLRPANYMEGQPGQGWGVYKTATGVEVGVVNLAGQVFMDAVPSDNPFHVALNSLKKLGDSKIRIVDFHAEVTSEKRAMGFHLDGQVTAVIGTHTHIQTADEQILPEGCAYITDAGMTGPHHSVIGMRKDIVLSRFRTGLPQAFKPAKKGIRLQGVFVEAQPETGYAKSIERVDLQLDQ